MTTLARKKILIVEDEISLRQALFDKFTRENFQALEAKNGEEGLEVALKERPDIILLDIIMPKVDGLTMLKSLRRDEWGKDVPVIILTNLNDAENVFHAVENNVYDFLVKSDWRLNELVERVKNKLQIS
ncbi:MAG: response regulator [Patescibacteria group bacterium]|jgi:DNA-binding response OmpR family regulator|nr:response regulator [Patescibacteria group bacterium]MDD5172705.1 response regulator [Patescibacteria group bacterium]